MITSGNLMPPFLELAFYLGPGDHRLAVSILLSAIEGAQAKVSPEIIIREANGSLSRKRVSVGELCEQEHIRTSFAYEITGLTGLIRKSEILECDSTHVLLRTEAGPLSMPGAKKSARERAGSRIYQAFKFVSTQLEAKYGAVCIEYSLETPQELYEDPRSLAFRNFWLSSYFVPSNMLRRIEGIMTGAYKEEWPNGIYYSVTPAFNPHRIGLNIEDSQERSLQVGRVLSRLTP